MTEIKYKEGIVAFIDILGFSNLVLSEGNANKVNDVIEFVKKFQYLFNSSPQLNTKVAFFSDSIVLTTDKQSNLEMLFLGIWIAESYLFSKTGLLFRGGITKGLYYHEEAIAFGPAVVNSYELEKQAKYSRIIIQDDVIEEFETISLLFFKDLDGKFCFNPSAIGLMRNTPDGSTPTKEQLLKSFDEEHEFVHKVIEDNLHTSVIDKYLWRMRAFNFICEKISYIFNEYEIEISDFEISELKKKRITFDDFFSSNLCESMDR